MLDCAEVQNVTVATASCKVLISIFLSILPRIGLENISHFQTTSISSYPIPSCLFTIMRFFEITLGFVILPFSVAISCTDSSAFAWPLTDDSSSSGSGGSGSSIGSCSSKCGNSISCVQNCLSFEHQSNCNILGGSACTDTSSSGSIGGGDDDDDGGLIKERDTLDCDSDETCFAYKDGTLLCLDISTGMFISVPLSSFYW